MALELAVAEDGVLLALAPVPLPPESPRQGPLGHRGGQEARQAGPKGLLKVSRHKT